MFDKHWREKSELSYYFFRVVITRRLRHKPYGSIARYGIYQTSTKQIGQKIVTRASNQNLKSVSICCDTTCRTSI